MKMSDRIDGALAAMRGSMGQVILDAIEDERERCAKADTLRILVDWISADHSRRSFLIRSRHGSRELWAEIREDSAKFEITIPISELDCFSAVVLSRISRFAEIRSGK